MSIRITLAAMLAATALILVACGEASTTSVKEPAKPGVSTTISPAKSKPAPTPSELVTAADVEKVGGLSGIKSVEKASIPGAGGDINFTTADGKLVVMANFGDSEMFENQKSTPNYREALSGLGDAAFVGPSKDILPILYQLGFKKGDHSALLTTYMKGGASSETMLTMDQMKALAAVVISRW